MLDKNLELPDSVKKKVSKSFRSKGKPLSDSEKWMVLNVYQRCRDDATNSNLPLSHVYEKASYYAGVSRKVVVEIVSHYRRTCTIPSAVLAGNLSQSSNLH